jgi:hypothetical protein
MSSWQGCVRTRSSRLRDFRNIRNETSTIPSRNRAMTSKAFTKLEAPVPGLSMGVATLNVKPITPSF